MKKLLILLLNLLILIGLTGCSNKDEEITSNFESNTLNVFNWGEYIGEDVISNFEKKFNVKVNYSLFDSNEMLYTKLSNDESYDVIVPADYMLDRMIKEDLLQPLDYSIITNTEYLNKDILAVLEEIDENHVYSLPYFVATAGIVYRKDKVSLQDLQNEGWAIFKDPKYAGDIYLYDSERDTFMMALKDLGYSANTENLDEINEANAWLNEICEAMNPAYVTDEVIDNMLNERKALAFMYSGDAAYVTSENENIGFYIPESGSRIAVDGLCIPKTSKNIKLANEFINFMLEYDSAMDNSLTVGYTSSDDRVLSDLTTIGGTYEGNSAYLFDLGNKASELFLDNLTLREVLPDLWIKVKTK